jgi:hypothetical protein
MAKSDVSIQALLGLGFKENEECLNLNPTKPSLISKDPLLLQDEDCRMRITRYS